MTNHNKNSPRKHDYHGVPRFESHICLLCDDAMENAFQDFNGIKGYDAPGATAVRRRQQRTQQKQEAWRRQQNGGDDGVPRDAARGVLVPPSNPYL